MKKQLNYLAIIACMSFVTIGSANQSEPIIECCASSKGISGHRPGVDYVELISGKMNPKPIFREKDGKVYVNLLIEDYNQVNIRITDSYSRVVFKETVAGMKMVQKVFDFSTAFEDVYTIKVSSGDSTFYGQINVR
jgi:hypothetical protein